MGKESIIISMTIMYLSVTLYPNLELLASCMEGTRLVAHAMENHGTGPCYLDHNDDSLYPVKSFIGSLISTPFILLAYSRAFSELSNLKILCYTSFFDPSEGGFRPETAYYAKMNLMIGNSHAAREHRGISFRQIISHVRNANRHYPKNYFNFFFFSLRKGPNNSTVRHCYSFELFT